MSDFMKDWPEQVRESKWLSIDTLPKNERRQILLRNDKEYTSAMAWEDGSIIDGKNDPNKEKIFFPTHWAHPKGMTIDRVDEAGRGVNGDGEYIIIPKTLNVELDNTTLSEPGISFDISDYDGVHKIILPSKDALTIANKIQNLLRG